MLPDDVEVLHKPSLGRVRPDLGHPPRHLSEVKSTSALHPGRQVRVTRLAGLSGATSLPAGVVVSAIEVSNLDQTKHRRGDHGLQARRSRDDDAQLVDDRSATYLSRGC